MTTAAALFGVTPPFSASRDEESRQDRSAPRACSPVREASRTARAAFQTSTAAVESSATSPIRASDDWSLRQDAGAATTSDAAGEPAAPPSSDDQPANAAQQSIARATRGVAGSKHDFSALTGKVSDACGACHVPHVQAVRPAERDGNQAMLELYRIAGQREVFEPGQFMPGASSLICLSCHNGAVAPSTVGTAHAILAGQREGYAVPDGWAARDHPIGVPYPAQTKGYRPLASVQAGGVIRLPEGRLECISCHDPHNAAGVDKMLVMSNQRSALCLACHEK